MTEGWHCAKCNALVTEPSVRHHYRVVHHFSCAIRLPGSATKVRMDRDPKTGRFKCPRIGCSATFELGQELQAHAVKCSKPLDYYSEEPSSEPRPAKKRKISHSSPPASAPVLRKRPERKPTASASASASTGQRTPLSSSRRLRAHTTQEPQTDRTQRALIRHCFKGGDMMISEIAEFVNTEPRTVWSVVRNEDGDDLEEDKAYLNCEKGYIVDVDALGELPPFVKREEDEEGQKLLRSRATVYGDNEYDSEDEIEHQYIWSPPVTPPPTSRRSRRMSLQSDTSELSALTSLADNEDATSQSHAHAVNDTSISNARHEPRPTQLSASPGPSSTAYSNDAVASPTVTRRKSDPAVEEFIRSLRSCPTELLLQLFREMEIDSAEHLDWLCSMPEDFWDDVKDYLLRRGVSLFHWLVIKKGFRDHAAAIAALADS